MRLPTPLLLVSLTVLGPLGCDAEPKSDGTADSPVGTTDDGASEDSGDRVSDPYVDVVQAACTSGESGAVEQVEAVRLESTVTWTLDFDEGAEAAGWVDCHYTREFAGVQRLDLQHVCPHCEVLVEGEAVMTEGFTDCAEPMFGGEPVRVETWGYAGSDIFRRGGTQLPLGKEPLATMAATSGDGTPVEIAWESEYTVNDEVGEPVGAFVLAASGTVAWQTDADTLIDEPFGPRPGAYSCGWECNDPGTLVGEYPLSPGGVLPNFRLDDQCGESVDIHDFYGSYLVLDSAQDDCGPCRNMAAAAEEFRDKLVADGIPVRLVPLLGNGLGDVAGTPDATRHARWVEDFQSSDPVLADRGWGYASLGAYLPEYSGTDIAWPAWIVIGPDMTVIEGNTGFSSWDRIEGIIRADWEARGEVGPL